MGFLYTFFAFVFLLAILAIPALIITFILTLLGVTMVFWKIFLITWLIIIVLKMLF